MRKYPEVFQDCVFLLSCGVSLLQSKEQGHKGTVLTVYCSCTIRGAQDARALVSRGDAGILRSLGFR